MKLTSIPLYNLIIIWEYDKCIIIGQQLSEDIKINDIDDNVNNTSGDIKTLDEYDNVNEDVKTCDVLQLPRTYCPIIEIYYSQECLIILRMILTSLLLSDLGEPF